jgi:hypothetical protein
VLTCVGSGLAMGQSTIQGFLPNVQKQIHKFQKSNSGLENARKPNLNLFVIVLSVLRHMENIWTGRK